MEFGSIQEPDNHEHEEDQRIIKGPNSQTASHIEVLEISLRLLGIQENPGDQQTREHEKKIDSHPPIPEQLLRVKHRIFEADVMHHHDENRYAANGIELRNSPLHPFTA